MLLFILCLYVVTAISVCLISVSSSLTRYLSFILFLSIFSLFVSSVHVFWLCLSFLSILCLSNQSVLMSIYSQGLSNVFIYVFILIIYLQYLSIALSVYLPAVYHLSAHLKPFFGSLTSLEVTYQSLPLIKLSRSATCLSRAEIMASQNKIL